MKKKFGTLFWRGCVLCMIIFNAVGIGAQEREGALLLNQEEFIERALLSSEDFMLSENQIDAFKAQYKEIRAQILPQVSGESSWLYNASFPEDTIDDYDVNNTISARQILWAFGRIKSALSAAGKACMISSLDKDATREAVIYRAKHAYAAALLAEETYSIIQASYENAVSNKEILEERSANGRVSKQDNIKISADIAARIPAVRNARAELKAAHNALRFMINEPDQTIQLTDRYMNEYKALDYNKLENALLSHEARLQSLQEALFLKDDIIQQREAGYMPAISAFGSYSYKGGDDSAVISSNNLDSYSAAGVKVSVPIFTGLETTALLEQAKIDKRNAELLLQKTRKELLLELKNAVSDYHEYIETLKANNEAVRLAEESFSVFQELFKTGQITVMDLNDAELALTNQKLAREETLFFIYVTIAKIEQLTTREGEA